MSTLSELLPSGGGGSTVDFVASGTLPNGKPVILKADGTVEVVAQTTTVISESIPSSSPTVFNTNYSDYTSVSFDPNDSSKFVVAYETQSNGDGAAAIGVITGSSISFGSAYTFSTGNISYVSVAFDPNNANKFVVAYMDQQNSGYGIVRAGSVSGTSISYSSLSLFSPHFVTAGISLAFDPNASGKFVIAFSDMDASYYGKARVVTLSGNSFSYGSEVTYNSANTGPPSVSFDPNDSGRFVIVAESGGSSGRARVGLVTGTSISFGGLSTFNSGSSQFPSVSFDPNNVGKCIIAYRDGGSSGYGKVVVGTTSSNSISFGSEYTFNSSATEHISVLFDSYGSGKFVVIYRDDGNSRYGTARSGTRSGNAVSFGSELVFNSGDSERMSVSFNPVNKGRFVATYVNGANSGRGTAILGQLGFTQTTINLTATNFVGTSTAAYTNGQTATIAVQGGLSTNQTGLTIGSTYFVQPTGTLATTAGTPSVNAGKALSATTLLLKDL
mgnify:CR=1 FL=1